MTGGADLVTRAPLLVGTRAELADAVHRTRSSGGTVVLVPTMGALHAGHASLIREARAHGGPDAAVVVSIFVNPLQFGEGEDLDRYPRTFEADLEMCGAEGVDVVLAPPVDEVYPDGRPQVTLDPGPLAAILEGASRPTHFAGVLVVVAKLLGLVRPDVAVFGEKDYQQLVLVRRMVRDLGLGVDIVGVPTTRDADGVALSSRNRYLDPDQRVAARALSRALGAAQRAGRYGGPRTIAAARAVLHDTPGIDVDYLALTGPDLGDPPEEGEARMLVAARVGDTRLIDNAALHLQAPTVSEQGTS